MKTNRTLILNTLLIVIFYSCTPENPTPNPTPTTLSIGQIYQGGKIAYIDASGLHGLIAAPSDQEQAPWGCAGTSSGGAIATAIGYGSSNTIYIMNSCSQGGIAARLCGDLVLGGYSDWYLPSKDELNQLYINRVAIGGFATNPEEAFYWSSSEYLEGIVPYLYSWEQNFASGGQYNDENKSNICKVRAVRSF